MSGKKLSMRTFKEVLRLKWTYALSDRQIARSCSIGRATVGDYMRRAEKAGLSWPLPEGMDDSQLDAHLFPIAPPVSSGAPRAIPDWTQIKDAL